MSRGLAALDDQSPKDVPGPDNPFYFFFFAAFFFVPFLAAFFFFAIAQSPPRDLLRVGGGKLPLAGTFHWPPSWRPRRPASSAGLLRIRKKHRSCHLHEERGDIVRNTLWK